MSSNFFKLISHSYPFFPGFSTKQQFIVLNLEKFHNLNNLHPKLYGIKIGRAAVEISVSLGGGKNRVSTEYPQEF